MLEENESKEKTCLFFASDYHFEMITLPYISKNLKENKNVVVMTENNLEKTVGKLLENLNLASESKESLEKIDWNNNKLKKIKEIQNSNIEGKDVIIFIKGKEEYIKNFIENNKVEIINCYDINQISEDVNEIVKQYNNVLATSGIEKLL